MREAPLNVGMMTEMDTNRLPSALDGADKMTERWSQGFGEPQSALIAALRTRGCGYRVMLGQRLLR
jgi:hypothetical protein